MTFHPLISMEPCDWLNWLTNALLTAVKRVHTILMSLYGTLTETLNDTTWDMRITCLIASPQVNTYFTVTRHLNLYQVNQSSKGFTGQVPEPVGLLWSFLYIYYSIFPLEIKRKHTARNLVVFTCATNYYHLSIMCLEQFVAFKSGKPIV